MERIPQTSLRRVGVDHSSSRNTSEIDLVQLLEVTAHDLRNPISGILAAGQYLLEDAAPVLDEHHIALLQSIDSSGRAMLALIEDALELCSIESGNLRLDIKTTDIQPVLHRAVLLSQVPANAKKIHLDVHSAQPASLPPIEIDSARILRAVDSVLSSSIRLARPGSRIEIGAGARGGNLTIWARTDGFGISTMGLRSLFNHFRKGSRSNRPGVEGGIALSLAKVGRIVEAHGGSVRVEGRAGQDSTIKLSLPLPSRAIAHRGAAGAP
jgi:signal transduction histidine kinase